MGEIILTRAAGKGTIEGEAGARRRSADIPAENGEDNMAEEYGPDLISVLDDEGNEHVFELLDAIETDDGRFVALLPVYEDPSEELGDDGELIILAVDDSTGEELLVPIEDDALFEEIGEIFEERLADLFEVEEVEGEADDAQ